MSSFKEAAERLSKWPAGVKVFAGLDGFVDEIVHVVETRYGPNEFRRYEKIADFGEKVKQAGGLSANFEMEVSQVKLGGNGPILANALLALGAGVTYIGALGCPDIHPVFKPMSDHPACRVISAWEPAHTDALEFADGKLIMGKMRTVNDITWDSVINAAGGIKGLASLLGECDMVCMLNWTMLPHMSAVWEGILNEVMPLMDFDSVKPFFFADLADPAKRTKDDILKALGLLMRFNERFNVILGLNEKESWEIAVTLGVENPETLALKTLAEMIYLKLPIHCIVIHPAKEACAVTSAGSVRVPGPYCQTPALTTGAGDNFNAGFCIGRLAGLSVEESLMTGVSASGYYVRKAASPTLAELTRFMQTLDGALGSDISLF